MKMMRPGFSHSGYGWLARLSISICFIILLTGGLAMNLTYPRENAVAIDIATDPPDATVQLDGHTIGETPISTIVPEGEHELILSREGFTVIDRKIFADASAPSSTNRYTFGLKPTAETLTMAERAERIESLERRIEEAFKRGDYVAPEHDNAWYYLNKLQELDPSNELIGEMRERIRRVLKQQAEMLRQRNDLA
jgi:hypothetical protein